MTKESSKGCPRPQATFDFSNKQGPGRRVIASLCRWWGCPFCPSEFRWVVWFDDLADALRRAYADGKAVYALRIHARDWEAAFHAIQQAGGYFAKVRLGNGCYTLFTTAPLAGTMRLPDGAAAVTMLDETREAARHNGRRPGWMSWGGQTHFEDEWVLVDSHRDGK